MNDALCQKVPRSFRRCTMYPSSYSAAGSMRVLYKLQPRGLLSGQESTELFRRRCFDAGSVGSLGHGRTR